MHHHLDAYAYTNHLRPLPPQQKLLFALGVLGLALLTRPLTQGVIVIWLSVWTVGYARIPVQVYSRVWATATFFLLISLPALVVDVRAVGNGAAMPGTWIGGVMIGPWLVGISQVGAIQAAEIAMRSLSCLSCLLFILFTTPFAELLGVLRQCRVPPLLLDLLLLMYRFVFLFLDVVDQLQRAQQARGGYRTRQRWMHSVTLLTGQLVVRSLQRYQQFSLGLAARGFNGTLQTAAPSTHTYSPRYALESLLGCLLLVLLNNHP